MKNHKFSALISFSLFAQLQKLKRYLCYFFTGFFIVIIATTTGFSQTTATSKTTLPAEAQEAINKGIMAAKLPDYLLAVSYFQNARKMAPDAPEIFFDLGLAESKIPGRELRAICWFSAYLSANPTALNVAAVKDQINILDVKSQSNLSSLNKNLENAVAQLSTIIRSDGDNMRSILFGHDKVLVFNVIAKAKVNTGDLAGAIETANMNQIAFYKCWTLECIAGTEIRSGDTAGSKKTLLSAIETARLIQDLKDKVRAQADISEIQVEAGDIPGARETISFALKTVDKIKDEDKEYELERIAEAQAKTGDIAAAQLTFEAALKSANLIKDPDGKRSALQGIAEAQAKVGSTINSTSIVSQPSIQPLATIITVADWLKKLDDNDETHDCPLNTGPFLDFTGYLKALPPSDDSYTVFSGLLDVNETIVNAQITIDEMLKRQAKQHTKP